MSDDQSYKEMIGEDLVRSCSMGDLSAVKNLLSNRADINHRAIYTGSTPLTAAILTGKQRIVEFLLESGELNVDLADSQGWTPLHFAADAQHQGIVAALIRAKADVNRKNALDQTPLDRAEREGECLTSIMIREAGGKKGKRDEFLPPKKMPTELEQRVENAETRAALAQSQVAALESRVAALEARG